MSKHLIPNAMGAILVTMTLTIPSAIFTESFLSYLGLGVNSTYSKLGNHGVRRTTNALRYSPWRLFFPAMFISFNHFCI